MKVALCCIGKNENSYIIEYVEYYKSLGIDKIFLYDNNDNNGERFDDILKEYVDNEFIDIVDYRNMKRCQLKAYQDCYDKHKNDYDWIMFFDCDEFIRLQKHNSISDYLSSDIFNNYDLIHLNWLCYGDNNLIGDDDEKSVLKRFKNPVEPLDFKVKYKFAENCHIKSIVRGGLEKVEWKRTPHTPNNALRCCNNNGRIIKISRSPFESFDYTLAYLKHFTTKTATEYMKKVNRGFPDHIVKENERLDLLNRFFKYNKRTEEKEKILGLDIIKEQERIKSLNNDNITIFINTIKDEDYYPINQHYKLLCLGNNKLENNYQIQKLTDNSGNSISRMNRLLCEFTGIYWVWKNYNLTEYVGFCQYRKLFEFGNKIPNMNEIFENNDIILPKPKKVDNVLKHYSRFHNAKDIISLRNIFKNEKFKKYENAFAQTFLGGDLYCCNIFIMKKDDFKEYCEFVWDIATEFMRINNIKTYYDAIKRVENDKAGYLKNIKSMPQNGEVEYQARFMAYLIERLTNVFIKYKFKNPYYVNVVEKDDKYGVKVFK